MITPKHAETRQLAYSLIELLVVMGIIVLLSSLLIPAIGNFSTGGFTSTVSSLSETLDQARAYAVSKRTFVYVGIGEFKASGPTDQGSAGTGRVALFAVASRDGSRISQTSDFATKAQSISRLVCLQNVHLMSADEIKVSGTSGGLERPVDDSVKPLDSATIVAMNFPLSGTPRYICTQCIEFSPQGMTKLFPSTNLPGFIEIGIAPTKGDAVPPTQKNVAVVQLSGLTGRSIVYRP